jgi:hypothetical protein
VQESLAVIHLKGNQKLHSTDVHPIDYYKTREEEKKSYRLSLVTKVIACLATLALLATGFSCLFLAAR